MVERHHRRDRLLAQVAQDVAVVANLSRVEDPLRRLDARPVDGPAVSVLGARAEQREVLAVARIVVTRYRGRRSAGDVPRLLLPLPPVVVAVVALDLVCGARRSPEETSRERQRHQAAALAGFSTCGGATYSQAFGVSPSISSCSRPALWMPLRCISRSLWGRWSRRIHAAFKGSAWLIPAIVSPGCSRARRRTTPSTRPPITSTVSSPGSRPRFALCTIHSGRRTGICQYGTPCRYRLNSASRRSGSTSIAGGLGSFSALMRAVSAARVSGLCTIRSTPDVRRRSPSAAPCARPSALRWKPSG